MSETISLTFDDRGDYIYRILPTGYAGFTNSKGTFTTLTDFDRRALADRLEDAAARLRYPAGQKPQPTPATPTPKPIPVYVTPKPTHWRPTYHGEAGVRVAFSLDDVDCQKCLARALSIVMACLTPDAVPNLGRRIWGDDADISQHSWAAKTFVK